MKINYRNLEQAIGYRFKKKAFTGACLDPSFLPLRKQRDRRRQTNGSNIWAIAVFEFNGSRNTYLKNYPDAREGDMSKLRSRLTQDRKLAQIGATICISEFLLLGIGERKKWRG